MTGKFWSCLLLGACCGAACAGLVCVSASARAAGPPPCEPGYRIVEETCYQEVVHKVCRMVPDVKKTTKVVYDYKVIDYCLPKSGHHCPKCGQCACSCGECGKPRTKKVLLKRFVTVEEPTYKCVVECVVERVPFTVYRKVPCFSAPAVPTPPLPPQ